MRNATLSIYPMLHFVSIGIVLLLSSAASMVVHASAWDDLWFTPHQQASQQLKNGDYQALTDNENSLWQGVGHYELGDHAAAVERFGDSESVISQYNHATSLTQLGEYDKAIELFDSVLERQPDHAKALKNRDIARQLKELQQQQQQQQQDSQEDESDKQNDEQQSSEQNQGKSSQNQDSQSAQNDQESSSQSPEQQQDQQPELQQEQQSEENAQVAESQQELEEGEEAAQQQTLPEAEVPLSEDQQATEQWLRKIPDDPAGLLRRKLRRNHAAEYPNVVNGDSPW